MKVKDLHPLQAVAVSIVETTNYYREPTVNMLLEAADLTDEEAADMTVEELVEKAREAKGFPEWMERHGDVQGQNWKVWLPGKEGDPTVQRTPEQIAEAVMLAQVGEANPAVTYTTDGAEILRMIAQAVTEARA